MRTILNQTELLSGNRACVSYFVGCVVNLNIKRKRKKGLSVDFYGLTSQYALETHTITT